MSLKKLRGIRPGPTSVSLFVLLGVTVAVMALALRSPLKDDIAWLLYVARRWIAGKELYVDLIEVNPPLIVWISAIPLTIARWLGVSPEVCAMPFFAAIALGGAWWSACLLQPLGGLFAKRAPVFAAIGIVLLVIPAADLGQREHLLIAAFLPYLVVFARSLDGLRPGARTAAAVGVGAALGCALKPQYALVFVALEIVALCHRLRPWRVAPVSAGATLLGYVGLVAIVCPAYLRRAVPMALALYGATDVSFGALFLDSAPLLAAEALALFLWWRRSGELPERSLLLTGVVFSAVSSLIFFLDSKDWFYHRLPATVMTVLVLSLWACATLWHRPDRSLKGIAPDWRGLTAAGLALLMFCGSALHRLQPEMQQAVEPKVTTVARLEALIRLHHARSYIAFSEWIALGFPVVNNTGVAWASRFDSMWALKGEIWRASTDPAAAAAWPVARWVARDFLVTCPDLAVVDTREGVNYIKVLSAADPSFGRAWLRYRQLLSFDGLTVYKRGRGGCGEPWAAAQKPEAGSAIR